MIRLSKSIIGEQEKQAVLAVLDREFLGMGTDVRQFEQELSHFFTNPAVCTNSGTAALQLALQACDVGLGDEVLVSSVTYIASFQAISATGAIPIACDVDYETITINIRDAENKITDKTKVIMPVHYSGGVGDLDAIYELAKKYSLRVIEDAAHAFGSTYKGKRIGSFGDIACFSFDGIKNITSGEGGCIVSTDDSILDKIKDSRLLGVIKDTDNRFDGKKSWQFDVKEQGWRYHMSNIMAAIGIEQLKRFSELAQKRTTIARLYDSLLKDSPNINTIRHNYDEIVPHIYVIKISKSIDKKHLQKHMLDRGIETGVHYFPNHKLSFYKENNKSKLKVSDRLYQELLSLPLHPEVSEFDVKKIVNVLQGYL